MRTASFLAFVTATALTLGGTGRTAAQPKGPPPKPQAIFEQFRNTMTEGKYDIAGIFLDEFLKSDPSDTDFLEIEKKYGTNVFQLTPAHGARSTPTTRGHREEDPRPTSRR